MNTSNKDITKENKDSKFPGANDPSQKGTKDIGQKDPARREREEKDEQRDTNLQ